MKCNEQKIFILLTREKETKVDGKETI